MPRRRGRRTKPRSATYGRLRRTCDVGVEAVLLLDDLHENCADTEGCMTIRVDEAHGFRLCDLGQVGVGGSARL